MMTPAPEQFLTKRQLAERLHKSVRCIENWMRTGYLPYLKIGRSVLFDWSEVVSALRRMGG